MDNHDSFVFNIVQYLLELGADCVVRDRTHVTLDDVRNAGGAGPVDGVLLSPGPGHPLDPDARICLDLVHHADAHGVPLLGVCLGHQAIAAAYGGAVTRAPEVVHGRTSLVHHDGAGVLAGLPRPFRATRYHSLAVEPGSLPEIIEVTAWTAGPVEPEVIMGLRHRTRPIEGVQFHPESVLSEGGHRLLGNWLGTLGRLGATTPDFVP